MIPKIIHYCWFGRGPLPELAQKCIASWKKYLPDYEIKEWNEDNFDVNIIPYTAEAYKAKKYAFVSDYARFWILHQYGGIYFDTDVEVIRPLDDIIERGNFMGFETDPKSQLKEDASEASVNPGLGMGVAPGLGLIKKMLDFYEGRHFEFIPGGIGQLTIVHIATEVLRKAGLKQQQGIQQVDDMWIYPAEYFCPINLKTGRIHVRPNTRTIHHYAGTWQDKHFSFKEWIKKVLPESLLLKVMAVKTKRK
jgi:mannosyltransferase OCH1-like enzyme